ncbi:hypothetical protein [Marinicrinis sediminis]|uniref:Tail fiber protein n=1 Tax=Marinicrinis sediminis TaxID=1652465 RepID=A0ABW5RBP9_9BACL
MPTNTPNINLRKIDPATDGNLNVNIDTDFNDNWDKIDQAVGNTTTLTTTDKTSAVSAINELDSDITGHETRISSIESDYETTTGAQAKADAAEANAIAASMSKKTIPPSGDLSDFKELNAFFVHDTGSGAAYDTPLGDLTYQSGRVFIVENVGRSSSRLLQRFTMIYPTNTYSEYFRLYNGDTDTWTAWKKEWNEESLPNPAQKNVDNSFTVPQTFQGSVITKSGNMYSDAPNSSANAHFWLRDENGVLQGLVFWNRATDDVRVRRSNSAGNGVAGELIVGELELKYNANPVWHEGNLPYGANIISGSYTGNGASSQNVQYKTGMLMPKMVIISGYVSPYEVQCVHTITGGTANAIVGHYYGTGTTDPHDTRFGVSMDSSKIVPTNFGSKGLNLNTSGVRYEYMVFL